MACNGMVPTPGRERSSRYVCLYERRPASQVATSSGHAEAGLSPDIAGCSTVGLPMPTSLDSQRSISCSRSPRKISMTARGPRGAAMVWQRRHRDVESSSPGRICSKYFTQSDGFPDQGQGVSGKALHEDRVLGRRHWRICPPGLRWRVSTKVATRGQDRPAPDACLWQTRVNLALASDESPRQ
jgi:hypothetical protein